MDHLVTDEERKARWYSKIKPRTVPVRPAADWHELFLTTDYRSVASVPFSWLGHDQETSKLSVNLKRILEQHGFVVISGVLDADECRLAIDDAWDYLHAASRVEQILSEVSAPDSNTSEPSRCLHRDDPSTLTYFPKSVEGGILPFYGSGHSTLAWRVRSHPNVRRVFATIFNTDDLIASLDGIILWPAGRLPSDAGWFHVDQNPRARPGRESIQGLVNLVPLSSGGTALVAGSHRLYPHHYLGHAKNALVDAFYRQRLDELRGDDWMEIDPLDNVILDPARVLCLNLAAGDVLLWDSRTVHCSYPCEENNAVRGLVRAATLVTMMPTMRASDEVLRQRIEAVKSGRTLTHWANKVAPLAEESDEASVESQRVQLMRQEQPSVLLDWNDLTKKQQQLVIGHS